MTASSALAYMPKGPKLAWIIARLGEAGAEVTTYPGYGPTRDYVDLCVDTEHCAVGERLVKAVRSIPLDDPMWVKDPDGCSCSGGAGAESVCAFCEVRAIIEEGGQKQKDEPMQHQIRVHLVDNEGTGFKSLNLVLDADGEVVKLNDADVAASNWSDVAEFVERECRNYALNNSWTKTKHVLFVNEMRTAGQEVLPWRDSDWRLGDKRPAVVVSWHEVDAVRRRLEKVGVQVEERQLGLSSKHVVFPAV